LVSSWTFPMRSMRKLGINKRDGCLFNGFYPKGSSHRAGVKRE
jgi:hypothetical protein